MKLPLLTDPRKSLGPQSSGRYTESPSKRTQQRMHMRRMYIIMGIIAVCFIMELSPSFG